VALRKVVDAGPHGGHLHHAAGAGVPQLRVKAPLVARRLLHGPFPLPPPPNAITVGRGNLRPRPPLITLPANPKNQTSPRNRRTERKASNWGEAAKATAMYLSRPRPWLPTGGGSWNDCCDLGGVRARRLARTGRRKRKSEIYINFPPRTTTAEKRGQSLVDNKKFESLLAVDGGGGGKCTLLQRDSGLELWRGPSLLVRCCPARRIRRARGLASRRSMTCGYSKRRSSTSAHGSDVSFRFLLAVSVFQSTWF
jgi:hypothetical protein